ncbi:MAG: helix-turn-helix domain-containing protein [Dehalococcoidia bacterium]
MPTRRQRPEEQQILTLDRTRASEFCTVAEAAELLGVSVSTIWRWVDSGKVPAFRVGPKAIRIRRQDAEAAVQPIAHREEVTMMNTVFVDVEAAVRPLTREEKERGFAALTAADKLREEILKRRKGKPLSDSAIIIREAREERSRRI